MVTDKWQRRKINAWIFAVTWEARQPGRNYSWPLLFLERLEFDEQYAGSIIYAKLAEYAARQRCNSYKTLDLLRWAVVHCPCKSQEDFDYAIHLMHTYYHEQR